MESDNILFSKTWAIEKLFYLSTGTGTEYGSKIIEVKMRVKFRVPALF
jgi:hypothetical protein